MKGSSIWMLVAVATAFAHVNGLQLGGQRRSFLTASLSRTANNGPSPLLSTATKLRGGFIPAAAISSPQILFQSLFAGLASLTLSSKVLSAYTSRKVAATSSSTPAGDVKPEGVKSLQWRFLIVFWLMRLADWLQGPYFYEVYSSKIINGLPVSLDLVSKIFLVGFATTGIFGPWIGRWVDSIGRKAGTLMYALLYTIGALSTRSAVLPLLLLGRVAGGLGTSLLFSAPEAWLVGEHQKGQFDGKWLGQTFGWAYAGDSLVAITAGQLAAVSAAASGPTGPFTLSLVFLALGSLIASLKWQENVATRTGDTGSNKPTISDAWKVMVADKRIMLLGAVQSLFEGAMYIFVLQWPPAIKAAIQASHFGPTAATPFGTVFSCFMACCLVGSTAFGALQAKNIRVETSTSAMLLLATAAMGVASAVGGTSLTAIVAAFFAFEACVGMYFPSIGTLRSKYIPDSHRSVIMNIFGVPLNLLVVSVFLSIRSLGVQGALRCATAALAVASICMNILNTDLLNGNSEKK